MIKYSNCLTKNDGKGRMEIPFPWERLTGEPLVYASMRTLQNGHADVFCAIAAAAGQQKGVQIQAALRATFIRPITLTIEALRVPLADSPLTPTTHLWKNSTFSDTSRAVAEIIMLINSIDPLAPYKVSDDLMLELVNVTALIKIDPEGAAAAACWIEIIEPHNLAKHQPRGGYMLDNRQIQMTCAKSAGVRLGDEIRLRVVR